MAGRPLSVGVTLEKLSAHTVDGLGREAFVKMNLLDILRKAVQLKRLSIYFDVDTPLLQPAREWGELQPGEWDALFLPGIAAPPEGQPAPALPVLPDAGAGAEGGSEGPPERVYVLMPVDGKLSYLRRGRKAQAVESDAKQEADLALQDISLHFSRAVSAACPAQSCKRRSIRGNDHAEFRGKFRASF